MLTGSLPKQLNHRKLAVENKKLEGEIELVNFTRLITFLESDVGKVKVKLEFRKERKRKTLVVGEASIDAKLQCQKCLSTMVFSLKAQIRHVIVDSEEALLDLPPDEDAILCVGERISLVSVFEDELIVNLPMIARHGGTLEGDQCRGEVVHENDNSPVLPSTHRPFATLADIKNDFKRS